MAEIRRVLVAGAGVMGAGIARVCAGAGYAARLYDALPGAAEKAIAGLADALSGRVEKGKMTAGERDALLSRVLPAASVREAADADIVIEAIVEDRGAKQEFFAACEDALPPAALLASNTSSILISEIAGSLRAPERFIGLHFFNPVPAMKLVEIIRGLKTSEETAAAVLAFAESLGKTAVFVRDSPGFLVNRINNALKNEAFACLAEGVASMEDIDRAMRLGLGHPMGPFELNDLTGLDIGVSVAEVLYSHFREARWKPFLPLRKLVMAGDLGRKTGRGWYDYSSGEKQPRTLNL